jgi:hypothetical protein|nr:hypothetical protein [uncultured Undibacterium sp.]
MPSVFPAHGSFSLHRDGNIVVSRVHGPWNEELVMQWAKAVRPYSLEMQNSGAWGGIAVISGSMLATPGAMLLLEQVVDFGVKNLGCIFQVVVAAPEVEGRGLVENAFQRIYEGRCLWNFFDDLETAMVWGNAQIDAYNASRDPHHTET